MYYRLLRFHLSIQEEFLNPSLIHLIHSLLGVILTLFVWISLGCKQILPDKEDINDMRNFTGEKVQSDKYKTVYETYSNNAAFYTTHI